MSRIGKKPIPLPDKVKVEIKPESVVVTGPKGSVTNRDSAGNPVGKEGQGAACDSQGRQRAAEGVSRTGSRSCRQRGAWCDRRLHA